MATVVSIAQNRLEAMLSPWTLTSPAVSELIKFFQHPAIKARWEGAPASSSKSHHHAYEGGLLVHTVEVLDCMTKLADTLATAKPRVGLYCFGPKVSYYYPQMLVAGCLHDASKIGDAYNHDCYVPNILTKGQRSDRIPFKTSDELYKYASMAAPDTIWIEAAHLAEVAQDYIPQGERSLALVRAISPKLYALLDNEMIFAIRYHDGAYGPGRRFLGGKETPLQMILHAADMWSSRMDREEYRA